MIAEEYDVYVDEVNVHSICAGVHGRFAVELTFSLNCFYPLQVSAPLPFIIVFDCFEVDCCRGAAT
jgi:hypothetical protein